MTLVRIASGPLRGVTLETRRRGVRVRLRGLVAGVRRRHRRRPVATAPAPAPHDPLVF